MKSGVLGVDAVVCHACDVWGYSSVMIRIAVEITGTVCGAGCSIFSQTVDCLPPLTADRSPVSQEVEAASLAATEKWQCTI